MHKGIIVIFLTFLFLSQTSFAETCPSVKDIRKNILQGWKVFDSDEGTVLSERRELEFKKNVEAFVLAEWSNEAKKAGTIHCYYRDKTGAALEAYLAKDHFQPRNLKSYWYEVSGYKQCAAGSEKCEFENSVLKTHTQLARNDIVIPPKPKTN